jgi:hypothetical protein
MTTADLIRRYIASAQPDEKTALNTEIRTRQLKITVNVVRAQERSDDVYVTAERGVRTTRSAGTRTMRTGDRHTFLLPLRSIAPVDGAIRVKAFNWYFWRADNLLSDISLQHPFAPTDDDAPKLGGEYHTRVEFDR